MQSNIFLTNKGELRYTYFERRFGYGASKKGGDGGKRLEDEDRIHYSDYDPMDNDDYAICFGAYLIARALKQTNVAQYIWFEILEVCNFLLNGANFEIRMIITAFLQNLNLFGSNFLYMILLRLSYIIFL